MIPHPVDADPGGDAYAPTSVGGPSGHEFDVEPPRMLGGRYLLEERIARGGMASVWRAHDEKLARTVAVKLLHRHLSEAPDFRERFRREAISVAKLSHPGVVAIYDTGADGPWVYLVMEFVEGATLADLLAADHPMDATDATDLMDPGTVARLGEQVAGALAAAGALGLVHRDVKPANILVDRTGQPKVTDFGIAKIEHAASDLTRTGMVLGTAAYLAPEQVRGTHVDHRADQYALGCVLYEALTGHRPFSAESSMETAAQRLSADPTDIRSRRSDVPADLADTIMRALQREPGDRWPDNRAFAAALRTMATDGRPIIDPAIVASAGGLATDHTADGGHTMAGGPAPGSSEAGVHETHGAHVIYEAGGTDSDTGPRPSFLRTEGRWIGVVLALLATAAVAVAIGLFTGVIDADGIPTLSALEIGAGDDEAADASAVGISADRLSVLDPPNPASGFPGGDGRENDAALANLVDDDPSTAWTTDGYNTATFGNLKGGVGVVVDLGEPQQVAALEVTAATPGVTVQGFTADAPSETLSEWEPMGDPVTVEDTATIEPPEPVEAQYALLWVTGELPSDDGRYRAGIAGLDVLTAG